MKIAAYMNNAAAARIAANTHLFMIANPLRLKCARWARFVPAPLTRPSGRWQLSLRRDPVRVDPGAGRFYPANPKPVGPSVCYRSEASGKSLTTLNISWNHYIKGTLA